MRRLFLLISILSTLSLSAAPIGEKRAREIANNFFATHSTRSTAPVLSLEWAGNDFDAPTSTRATDTESALLYIYNRADTEGFVVVAGDDRVEKSIIAFSHEGSFDVNDVPDGAKALLQAWCEQIAEARNSATRAVATRADVGTVVCQYETARWNQTWPYSKYTPKNFNNGGGPIGCEACGLAILCHYYKWPEKGIGTTPSYTYTRNGESRTIPANELGHTYDYSTMLSGDYVDIYSNAEERLEAIDGVARLMYDIAAAVQSKFNYGGTSASVDMAIPAMTKYFGYSKTAKLIKRSWYDEAEWNSIMQKNLEECGPTGVSGSNSKGSYHYYIADGYTDAGYFHINYGWGGSSNGYYKFPSAQYGNVYSADIGLVPDRDGSIANVGMMSLYGLQWGDNDYRYGIETNASSYKAGKKFKTTLSYSSDGVDNFKGTIMVAHCNKNDEIKDILWTFDAVLNAGSASSISFDAALSKSVESGDCLRMFYKNEGQEEWCLSRKSKDNTSDKVLLSATPQEVAKRLSLTYTKSSKTISIFSEHATQYTITNASGRVVTSGEVVSRNWADINVSTFESGTYTCSFACGGEPYLLKLKL